METKIVHNPPSARCYKCGSPDIFSVCHHCGRCMCKKHSHYELPVKLGLWKTLALQIGFGKIEDYKFSDYDEGYKRLSTQDEVLNALGIAKIVNPEFESFIIDVHIDEKSGFFQRLGYSWRQIIRRLKYYWGAHVVGINIGEGRHCEFCTHNVSRYPLLTWFGLILTLSLIGSPLGIPLIILGIWLNKSNYMKGQVSQIPPLPISINPQRKRQEIQVNDTLYGKITLNSEGRYSIFVEPAHGTIRINLSYGMLAYDRNRAYLQKLDDLSVQVPEKRKLEMGSILFGKASWEFHNSDIWHENNVNLHQLYSPAFDQVINDLISDPNQTETRILWENSYTIVIDDSSGSNSNLPVQVVVSIRPDSDKRALDLEIEFFEEDGEIASKSIIKEFYIWVPNDWGNVHQVKPEGKVEVGENLNGKCKKISWKKITFEQVTNKSYRRSFYLQFLNNIKDKDHLEGKIELSLPKTLSGIKEITFISPLGSKLFDVDVVENETQVYIDLDLDLSGLRDQTLTSIENKILREGVVPDSNLIVEIVTNLSGGDFYIKRITENPSRTSKEGAHKINRYWDIVGRKYSGVYPVEFHLVLTGEELVQREGGTKAGQLTVEMTVQGSTANSDMTEQVEKVSAALKELIIQKLDALPTTEQSLQQTHRQPQFVSQEYVHSVQEIPIEEVVEIAEIFDRKKNIAPQIIDDKKYRIQSLREKLDLIEDRVLEGKISEPLYYELKSKIENELRELISED